MQETTKPKKSWSENHYNEENLESTHPKRPRFETFTVTHDKKKVPGRRPGRPKGSGTPKVMLEKIPKPPRDPNVKRTYIKKKHYQYRGRPRVMTGEEYVELMQKKPGIGRKKKSALVNTNYNLTTPVKKSLLPKKNIESGSENDSTYTSKKKRQLKSQ